MLSKRRRKLGLGRVRAYVASLLPAFRLQHWEVLVEDDQPQNASATANCWTADNTWQARLRFADSHFEESEREQVNTVAHELLHVVTARLDLAVRDIIDGLEPSVKGWARERYDRELEHAVDHLARVIEPLLPRPPQD